MTDETRPETTPPTPDGDKPGSAEKDDSLDSWFRPGRAKERESGEVGVSAPASASARASEPEAKAEPERERELETPEASAESDAEEADEGVPADRADAPDEGERADRVESTRVDSRTVEPRAVGSETDQAETDQGKADQGKADQGKTVEAKAPTPSPANDLTQVMAFGPTGDLTQVIPVAPAEPASSPASADNDHTQVFPVMPPAPVNPVAAAPTQAIPRASVPSAAKPSTEKPGSSESGDAASETGAAKEEAESWSPTPGPQQQYKAPQPQPPQRQEPWQPQQYQPTQRQSAQQQPAKQPSTQHQPAQYQEAPPQQARYQQSPAQAPSQAAGQLRQRPYQQSQTRPYEAPGGVASILPPRGHGDDYDDFDNYSYADGAQEPRRRRARPALLAIAGVFVLIVAVGAALVFSGKVHVFGAGAKPVPTVGFSPSGSDAGSDATQTGTAFLTDWENGNLAAAANITDNQSAALAALTAYKSDLKVSGLTLSPGTASAQGWMTFSVTAQVGTPSSAWSYSSGMATYSSTINGYTRWFVKWQPNLMFTSLKSGQKLALGAIPPVANKVVDSSGTEITSANAPSLDGIVSALKKSAPPAAGTPGQQVQIENADGSVASKVVKLSDPVTTGAVKTTINLNVQKTAQSAVNQAPNSSMVVIQPSTGNILAVANNPTTGLDTAMLGKYAPGSTFKTITSTLVLNKGVITDLNQTWDCPATLNADGITLHNSEQEVGVGNSFLTDFAQSCNNAFSRFEGKVSRDELVSTAHDYYGFDQKWDVGLSAPTIYGHVPNTTSNSLAEELVGQDQIQASPLAMAAVAATVDNGSFKQPILVPGTQQISATPLPAKTDQDLKTLMHQVVVSGTLASILPVNGVYAKTGTAEVQGKAANSWTIAFRGDYAVAALAIGGNFGATTAGPEVRSLLAAVQ